MKWKGIYSDGILLLYVYWGKNPRLLGKTLRSIQRLKDIKHHIVWITKYRKPVLMGKIAVRTRGLINNPFFEFDHRL